MGFINNNNFVQWSASIETCYYALPLYAGDGINMFFNAVFELPPAVTFGDLKLGLYSDELEGIYLHDITTLNQVIISGTIFSMYMDEWIVPELFDGNYRFVIYRDGPETIIYYSNTFRKVFSTDYTSWIKYNNVVDTLGYLYESAPSFYNEFRIDLWTGRPTFNENVKGHDTYEGDFIQVKADIQKIVEFQTRFFDDGVHEAFFSMLSHSEVLIDDVQYKKTQDKGYEIAWSEDDDNKIGNGAINLLVVDYSSAVKTC
jgi:hypothetical protein